MSAVSLAAWLSDAASRDALLAAWQKAPDHPLDDYEACVLAATARAARAGTPITVAVPGGRCRMPLLAAVHAAALRLPGFPSPFRCRDFGPVALVTTQVIRRAELIGLDAAGVPVSPALHAARLRADQQVAPLPAGKPTQQTWQHLLLLISPSANWALPKVLPKLVVIDATDEPWQFTIEAVAWAEACGAVPIVFADLAKRTWLRDAIAFPCGWAQILAASSSNSRVGALAAVRGHAVVLTAGPIPGLAQAAVLLADGRRHGPLPPVLLEASGIWRRLDELVVPITAYDAACPRWHMPTLSERLEDVLAVRAQDFPRGWRTWAQTGWAGIKEGLASARTDLRNLNRKAALLAEAVDADLRAGLSVDVALPSRIARDAAIWNLADVGVPLPVDGQLVVRSLADTEAWDPPRATVLAAPPGTALRHRMTAADVGALSVLCYDHELGPLHRMLKVALNEPAAVGGPVGQLLPSGLTPAPVLPSQRPAVVLTVAPASMSPHKSAGRSLSRLADAADIAGLAALEPLSEDRYQACDLPDDIEIAARAGDSPDRQYRRGLAAAIPLTVALPSSAQFALVHVPADAMAVRTLDGVICRIPFREVLPGMLLVGLDGQTPFDRLRPLLPEARGPVARMMLASWEQALTSALRGLGSPAALSRALGKGRVSMSASGVAAWADEDRIGPRNAANVARVGELAGHPVVAGHAHAIATTMRHLRRLHQAIGRLVASPHGLDAEAAAELEQLLGPDALSILAEIVIYRVVEVGALTTVDTLALFTLSPSAVMPSDPAEQEGGG